MTGSSTDPALWGMTRTRSIAGFVITELTQPPHRRLPWHVHTHASVCFVLAGQYTERVGAREWECPRHSLVLKPPGERHADEFGSRGGTCLLIEISPDRLAMIDQPSTITTQPGLVRNPRLAALGHRVHGEFSAEDPWSALVVEGLMLEILGEGARACGGPRTRGKPAWLRRALELIHDGYAEPLTLSFVAREVGVHPAHLARTFRQQEGVSIGEYVRRLRIERATGELAGSSASIAGIGLRAGFFDQSHFSRVFRQHTGMSPAQFRTASCRRNAGTGTQRPS